jgi:hypothetical protein
MQATVTANFSHKNCCSRKVMKSTVTVILLILATLGDVTQGVAKPKIAEASTILSYGVSPTVCEKLSQCTLDFNW